MRFRSQLQLRHPRCTKTVGLTQRCMSPSPSEEEGSSLWGCGPRKPAGLQQEGHQHRPIISPHGPRDRPFQVTHTCSPLSRFLGQVATATPQCITPFKPPFPFRTRSRIHFPLLWPHITWPLSVRQRDCGLGEEGEGSWAGGQ